MDVLQINHLVILHSYSFLPDKSHIGFNLSVSSFLYLVFTLTFVHYFYEVQYTGILPTVCDLEDIVVRVYSFWKFLDTLWQMSSWYALVYWQLSSYLNP